MNAFLLAVQFLTILPLKIKEVSEKNMADSMIYFPVVGLLLGLMLSVLNKFLLVLSFSSLALNTILVVALIIITGGMHLDGVSDTADAFLSRKPKEEMLAIMRDSHIGVMGVLILISIILLKIGLLSFLSTPLKTTGLFLACVLSRWSCVLSMFLFPYARQDGKAKVFIQTMNSKIFGLSTITAVICALAIWRIKGLVVLLIIGGCTYLSGKLVNRKIGGITGDTLGATIELTEVITLFSISLAQGVNYG